MIPRYGKFFFKTYLYLFGIFTLFRFISTIVLWKHFADVELSKLSYAFWMGWRFDNVIICATLILPFILLTFDQFIIRSTTLQKIATFWIKLWVPGLVLLQMIDVIYYEHFQVRITSVILNWVDDLDFTVKMLKDEPAWLFGVGAMPVFMWAVNWPIKKFQEKNFSHPLIGREKWIWLSLSLVLILTMGLGIRGRVAIKSPIREGTAFFSKTPTLNHLALNPCFTFFSSLVRSLKYKDKPLQFMKDEEMELALEELYQFKRLPQKNSLTRIVGRGQPKDLNVVIVIMEGMSAYYTRHKKNPSWTPVLDRLMDEGINFTNAFSAGTHTYNGVWSTLFSFPAPYSMHPLKVDIIPSLNSFAFQASQKNRQTFFFTTHDDQFDNMAGFVRNNGFDEVFHQGHHPRERVFSILGVPDHDMFDLSQNIFKEADQKGRFFAALLTGTNHKPYVIPPELKEQFNSPNMSENIVRYADWSIGEFLKKATQEEWGKRTIFAFVADHGHAIKDQNPEDQILSYHHVPFIIWAPNIITPKTYSSPAHQVDLIPTVLSLLGGQWTNTTLGDDVITRPRRWAHIGRDDSICLILPNKLSCESQALQKIDYTISHPLWMSSENLSEESIWRYIHAEFQQSYHVLRKRLTFP